MYEVKGRFPKMDCCFKYAHIRAVARHNLLSEHFILAHYN